MLVAIFLPLAVVLVVASTGPESRPAPDPIPPGVPVLTIGGPGPAGPIAPGFIGLSLEYPAVMGYAGIDASAVDPVFLQLIRNLTPGQAPVLRIGGDSGDRTWVPVPGMNRPPGVNYTLGSRWLATAGALARDLNARMILGLDLEANSTTLAATEARAMIAAIGADHVAALELGNEPELYSTFPWYRANGHGVPGRVAPYPPSAYNHDFARFARALPAGALAGPATGGPVWMRALPQFLAGATRLGVVTVHRYPLQRCFVEPGSPLYPTISNLLAPGSSRGLARSVAFDAASARAHGVPLRVDELNSVACRGQHGVSDTFASALWALDTLFAMARVGVTGVNIHTFPGGLYQPFTLRHASGGWSARVKPAYYGLMMFAQAAPPDSRLLAVAGSPGGVLRTWATRASDGRIRVVLINESPRRSRSLALRVPAGRGPATLESLRASGLAATSGVTLGGQTFGAVTTTGALPAISPRSIQPDGAVYVVRLPPASAATLTLSPR